MNSLPQFSSMIEHARAYAHEEGLTRKERDEWWAIVKRLQKAQEKIGDIDARRRKREKSREPRP